MLAVEQIVEHRLKLGSLDITEIRDKVVGEFRLPLSQAIFILIPSLLCSIQKAPSR